MSIKMNANELSKLMLEWGDKRAELDTIEAEIAAEVLEMGMSFTVGNIRASYSVGRVTKDYEAVKVRFPPEIVEKHSSVTVSWAKACEEAGIEAPEKSKSEPSVTVKIV